MKEVKGKQITELKHIDALVIPGHGYITLAGDAFPIDGPALDVSLKWDNFKKYLGRMIFAHGSHVYMITKREKKNINLGRHNLDFHLVHFPIQPIGGMSKGVNVNSKYRDRYKEGMPVPGWAMKVDLDLVVQSAKELSILCEARKWKQVAIAQPEVSDDIWKKIKKKMRRHLKSKKYFIVLRDKKVKLPSVEEPKEKPKKVRRKKHESRKHRKHR